MAQRDPGAWSLFSTGTVISSFHILESYGKKDLGLTHSYGMLDDLKPFLLDFTSNFPPNFILRHAKDLRGGKTEKA